MNRILKHAARDLTDRPTGLDTVGADEEFARRDAQLGQRRTYRPLRADEIELLRGQGNRAADWGAMRVGEKFDAGLVRDCEFRGAVRIGDLAPLALEFDGMTLPVGLYHSTFVACDIGNDVALHHVGYLAQTLVGDDVIMLNVGRVLTTPEATFGCGGVARQAGSAPETGTGEWAWLEVGNENGGRSILAFDGMRPADAALWSRFRDEEDLLERLTEMTDRLAAGRGTRYSAIGARCVIRDTRSIKNVVMGEDVLIEGADRLEDLTIRSDANESTRIGEGTNLAEGVVGYGCRIDTGAKAFRFVLGTRCNLRWGARLLHTFLGDNSTVSCCEVQHSLIFPCHEQHHNNSFLIAGTIQGQSNIAAGATVGSNHNSRAADGELLAERGFWPGLCTSFKFPSRFAAFTLVAKGDYPHELNIMLPFSLVTNNEHHHSLDVMPGYWFLYNMYAIVRNAWKFQARDKRVHAEQPLETDYLAPDTVEAMLAAMGLIEGWVARSERQGAAKAGAKATGGRECDYDYEHEHEHEHEKDRDRARGREMLLHQPERVQGLEVTGDGMEQGRRKTRLGKVAEGYAVYREMALFYAVRELVRFMQAQEMDELVDLAGALEGEHERRWVNLGGQLVGGEDLDELKERIVRGEVDSWADVHGELDRLWAAYPDARARHAWGTLRALLEPTDGAPDGARWLELLRGAVATLEKIAEQTYASRARDYGPFRGITFASGDEMEAVYGSLEENAFIAQVREEAAAFRRAVERVIERNGLMVAGG